MAAVVADASVLIALHQIDQLSLLERLFAQVVIPPAVAREIAPSILDLPAWLQVRSLQQPADSRVLVASLDPGETEAISLALEAGAQLVILDDRPARLLAAKLGLPFVGTAGVLLAAKRRGLTAAVRPPLDALRALGFRLRKDVYLEILEAAGEGARSLKP